MIYNKINCDMSTARAMSLSVALLRALRAKLTVSKPYMPVGRDKQ